MRDPGAVSVGTAQVWVELKGEDPEAVSALEVARSRLAAGRGLRSLRRLRVVELEGPLPEREILMRLLHASTRFYNPHKERCTLRFGPGDPAPVTPGDTVVLVSERGCERRPAAERWWQHETGARIVVREGVAWVLGFAGGTPPAGAAAELTWTRDRGHGLFCNPHSQDGRIADGPPPQPWLAEEGAVKSTGRNS